MAGMVVTASMGVMNSLLKKLTALLGDEYKLLKDARHLVASLRDEMSSMGALLARMDGMEALDAQQAEWRRKVRDMYYDMEDCVDRFVQSLGDGGGGSGNSKTAGGGLVAHFKKLRVRHDLASQVQKLKARVEDVSRRRGRYRLQIDDHAALGNQQPCASPVTMDPRISALYEEATALVGIDASRRKITGWLTEEEEGEEGARRQQLRVVCIVGFGGIGKSTLARRAYNETRGQFDCSAFVSVSRSPNMKRIFADILSGVGAQCDVSTESYEDQLIGMLREYLKDKRYLIVIDDIWRENAWNTISCAFVENYRRSRVITTTRHQNVASACLGTLNFRGNVHTVEPLNDADSRSLFFRRVFNSEDCPEEFQTTSEQILKKCGGVPLAIISLASTLACQNVMVIETWEKMLNSLGYLLETSPSLEWMRHVLDLSYRDLCPNLRTCMLYLGIFPEDYIISKDDLVRRWIAEGFVCDGYGCVPEEIAEGYFIELVNRSIIQVAEFNEYNEAISCRVHDIMLDFIIAKATEDNFFAIVGTADQIRTGNPSIRRVSFCIDHMECDRVISNLDLSRARSLDLWACAYCRPCLSSLSFSLLRVLHLDVSHWSNDSFLLSSTIRDGCLGRSPPPPTNESMFCDLTIISNFHLLKYLKITSSEPSAIFGTVRRKCRLPEQIRTLRYLRTLDIDADLCGQFPEDVCEAASLSAIIVSDSWAPKLPHGIGRLKALRILKGFSVHQGSMQDIRGLGELSNLRELELGVDMHAGEPKAVALADALCKLSSWDNLRSLVLDSKCSSNIGELLSSWSPPPRRLRRLQVRHAFFPKVPDWTPLLSRLEFLDFRVQVLSSGGLDALARLPSLAHLALDVHQVLLPEGKLAIPTAAFPRLKKFCFRCRVPCDLVFEPGSMPNLHTLDVRFDAIRVIVETPSGFVPVRIEHLRFLTGIEHLQSLASFTAHIYRGWSLDDVIFRPCNKPPMNASHIGSPQELERWILHAYAEEILRLALSRHPGHPSVQIKYE